MGTGKATIDFGAPLTVGINPQDPQVAQGAFDLYGDAEDLGLSGGGDIGVSPGPGLQWHVEGDR